ncbi:uncharacterized protein LOC131072646 [Cryptomeria japonica]|uniref:uncharacterized protein LOC131072646 n=1 Tax=Cryptomeria japonica TaxID=3369 RepID=UPI0027DA768F|nr:uncharacterized protein LOC131072646 [Cryptomeria japonica]
MEFHPLNFGLLCSILLALGCLLEGGSALGIRTHSGMPARKNQVRCAFLEKLKRSRITNSYVSSLSKASYDTYNYTQVLDHFAFTPESYQTFPQRYFIDKSNWGGAQNNSPIFVWLGEEQDITNDVESNFMIDQVANFKALVVYIEHRYYGTSMPFGGEEEAYANASTMGYFTIAQALADYAIVIVHLKKTLNAENCPVVVVGGSYGGMLATWFRLKYPHITIGALASSAPILYLDAIVPTNGYDSVVTEDLRDASEICYRRINESWDMMDKIASTPQGLLNLSKLFISLELNEISAPAGTTMFPPYFFDIKSYSRNCYLKYGVVPRRHWLTTEFGGHDIKRVLKDFGSNIIFSNGLRDPWSAGGVLANISESIVAITTDEGTHCLDIVQSASDDPAWPKEQRRKEITIVQKWINDYRNQF